MNATTLFDYQFESALQTVVLIPLILLIQWVSRDRLSPTAKHALWLLLLIRLTLPELPTSAVSVFNLTDRFGPRPPIESIPAPANGPDIESRNSGAPRIVSPPQDARPSFPVALPLPNAAGSPTLPPPTGKAVQPTPALGSTTSHPTPAITPISSTPSASPPSDPVTAFEWQRGFLFLWLAGVLLLFTRALSLWFRLHQAMRQTSPIQNDQITRLLRAGKSALQLRTVPSVNAAEWIQSPALCGIIRPKIVLPIDFAQRYTESELTDVLLHELAHYKRRDAFWNVWFTLIQIAHWPNPLVWFAGKRMQADREVATDYLALSAKGDNHSTAYGETILKSLQSASPTPPISGLIGISENRNGLKQRFQMIARFQKGRRYSVAMLSLVLILAAAVSLTDANTPNPALAEAPSAELEATSNSRPQRTVHQVTVTVLDAETDTPVPDTWVGYELNWDSVLRGLVQTDANGEAIVRIAASIEPATRLVLRALPINSYRTQQRTWNAPEALWDTVATEHHFRLAPGRSIGGQVVDPQGNPMAQVAISIEGPWPKTTLPDGNQNVLRLPFEVDLTTDGQGRWFYDGAPPDLDGLDFTLETPGGVRAQFTTGRVTPFGHTHHRFGTRLDKKALSNQTALLPIPSGRKVTVTVHGSNGLPLAGARVTEIHGPFLKRRIGHAATTSEAGEVAFFDRLDQEIIYHIEHPDYAVTTREVFLAEELTAVPITLKPRFPLQGQVLGTDGAPIAKARLDWATPSNVSQFSPWQTETDSEGRFTWQHAPREPYFLRVRATDFATTVVPISPPKDPLQIVLPRTTEATFQLRASVVDATTNAPVESFTYAFVTEFSDGFGQGTQSQSATLNLNASREELTEGLLPSRSPRYYFCIRAPGYDDHYSRAISVDEPLVDLTLKLNPRPDVHRFAQTKILTPSGQPAEGARVIMVQSLRFKPNIQVRDDSWNYYPNPAHVTRTVDAQGRFELPPIPDHFSGVFIFHPQGTLALGPDQLDTEHRERRLEEPGSVQGTLRMGGRLVPNRKLKLSTESLLNPLFTAYFTAETDAQGRFQFDGVPSGSYRLYLTHPDFQVGMVVETYQMATTVRSGETTFVEYGHTGRTITGRLVPDPAGMVMDWSHGRYHLRKIGNRRSDPPAPQQDHYVSWRRYFFANSAYVRSPEIQKPEENSYYLMIGNSGHFEIEAVPPGSYLFDLTAIEPKARSSGAHFFNEKILGSLRQRIEIPEGPDNSRHDTGTIAIPIKGTEPVTQIRIPVVESANQKGQLSETRIRGKNAVIHLWASWAEDGFDWWPVLEDLHASEPTEDTLSVISLHVDPDLSGLKRRLAEKNPSWPVGHLSPEQSVQSLKRFGVRHLPAIVVAGSDGTVTIVDTPSEQALKETVNKLTQAPTESRL